MITIDAATRLCAVIGNPVAHSLSPAMHNAAFRAAGLNYVYLAFRVEDIGACLRGMRALEGFRGMSVTIPHKETILPHLDEVTPLARRIGCVNTVTRDDAKLIGANTDGLGTLRAFADADIILAGKRVLFLGTGGAVRAVAFAMAADAAPERITLLGRTPSRVAELAADLRDQHPIPIETGALPGDLETAMAQADVVINGTPVGMYPHGTASSPVPAALLRPDQVVFDMVYRPLRTRLLQDAVAAGCRTLEGSEMLVRQGELQFEMWTGQAPAPGVMRAALLAALGETVMDDKVA